MGRHKELQKWSQVVNAAEARLFRSCPRVLVMAPNPLLLEQILFVAPRALVDVFNAPESSERGSGVQYVAGPYTAAHTHHKYDVVFVAAQDDETVLLTTLKAAQGAVKECGVIVVETTDRHMVRPLAKTFSLLKGLDGLVKWASARCLSVEGIDADPERQVMVLHHRLDNSFVSV